MPGPAFPVRELVANPRLRSTIKVITATGEAADILATCCTDSVNAPDPLRFRLAWLSTTDLFALSQRVWRGKVAAMYYLRRLWVHFRFGMMLLPCCPVALNGIKLRTGR